MNRFRVTCRVAASLLLLALGTGRSHATDPQIGLLWIRDGNSTPQAVAVLDALRRADEFGLEPRDFADSLTTIDASGDDALAARRDAALSSAAQRLIDQLHDGRIDPLAAGYALNRHRASLDRAEALRRLAASADVRATLATFEPQSAQYRALTRTLARYRRIPADLTSLPVPVRRSVKEPDHYAGADRLRRLLEALGDAPTASASAVPDLYDADLAAGVARFQQRHGLTPDGVLGPRTFAALTVPVASRIRQIELTMERWRWLPDIQAPAVIVNVPQYMLYSLPAHAPASAPASRIPVIVGQSVRQTPIFDSAIESVVFRPYWNIPESIMREELLPEIAGDPTYLARHEMEIVRGAGDDADILPDEAASVAALRAGTARVRQRPGPGNALGLIKFVLPNPYSVYLHSSPELQLFSRERRALSHGCIRVSDAVALAAYLLAETEGDWSADRIEAATCGTETFTVRLATPVPVYILYGTVVIDPDGSALFFDDVYGYDRRLDALLTESRL